MPVGQYFYLDFVWNFSHDISLQRNLYFRGLYLTGCMTASELLFMRTVRYSGSSRTPHFVVRCVSVGSVRSPPENGCGLYFYTERFK